MTTINESGMTFKFPDDDCFLIEKDDIARKQCVKSCECVARISQRGKDLYAFIEAKSSVPREAMCDRRKMLYDGTPMDDSWTILTNFDNFINDICQKFEDSFSAYHAIWSGYHGLDAKRRVPSGCKGLDNTKVRFILIVNGFKEEWFPPINDALKKRIRHFLKVWNIPDSSVKTLNADGAYAEGIHVSIDG